MPKSFIILAVVVFSVFFVIRPSSLANAVVDSTPVGFKLPGYWPLEKPEVVSEYGMRQHPILGYERMHDGVDFDGDMGTPVYAATDGVVELFEDSGGYGNHIVVHYNDTISTMYAHLSKFAVTEGQTVKGGELIGNVGSTGLSTGPHLHFELHLNEEPIDPLTWLESGVIQLENSLGPMSPFLSPTPVTPPQLPTIQISTALAAKKTHDLSVEKLKEAQENFQNLEKEKQEAYEAVVAATNDELVTTREAAFSERALSRAVREQYISGVQQDGSSLVQVLASGPEMLSALSMKSNYVDKVTDDTIVVHQNKLDAALAAQTVLKSALDNFKIISDKYYSAQEVYIEAQQTEEDALATLSREKKAVYEEYDKLEEQGFVVDSFVEDFEKQLEVS